MAHTFGLRGGIPGPHEQDHCAKVDLPGQGLHAGNCRRRQPCYGGIGKWSNVRLAPHLLKQKPNEDAARNYTVSLRQTPVFVTSKRDSEDSMAIGGLRHPKRSIQKLSHHNTVGNMMTQKLDEFFDSNKDIENACYNAIGSDKAEAGPSQDAIEKARQVIARALNCTDTDVVANDDCQTPIRAGIIGAWARLAKDPAEIIESWCKTGAPGNILHFFPNDGIFPKVDNRIPFHQKYCSVILTASSTMRASTTTTTPTKSSCPLQRVILRSWLPSTRWRSAANSCKQSQSCPDLDSS